MAIPITGPSLGTPEAAAARAIERGAKRPDYLITYAPALWSDAEFVGLRADVLWAQADLETGNRRTGVGFQSDHYDKEGNTAGMGITDDKPDSSPGHVFEPAEMARMQVCQMAGYAGIRPPEEWIRANFRWDDMIRLGYFGSVKTTADLGGGRWATDPDYGAKIEERHALYFTEKSDMEVVFLKRIATSRLAGHTAKLLNLDAWFTIHENGNTRSGPLDEAAFVANGGGSQGVLYHFAVGVYNGKPTIVQIFPLDRRGIHAGNAIGNQTAIAVETCQAPPGALSQMTQAALRQLLYMVYTGDPRIDWGDRQYGFDPSRTNMHANWRGANPNCPQNMIAAWGGIQPVLIDVRGRLKDQPVPEPEQIGVGDTVATLVVLNVRAEPGTSAAILDTLQPGVDAVVTGRPETADGYEWVPLRLGDGREAWAATAGTDGAYLTVIERAPEQPAEPELVLGLPVPLISSLFGAVDFDQMRYAFNPEGVVSKLWLDYAEETDRLPTLASVFTESGKKVFQFADGLVITAPTDRPAEVERLIA